MTSRSLTDVFVLMRNNALQSRHILAEQNVSDHARLLRDDSSSISLRGVDLESGRAHAGRGGGVQLPPAWSDSLEETQYIISRLRSKISELKRLHSQHLQRPTLDDGCAEERQADRLTSEISRQFATAHRIVHSIKEQCDIGSPLERRLANNVLSSLAATLQDLSLSFRTSQSDYLRSLTSREERSNAFFEPPNFEDLDSNESPFALAAGPGPSSRPADADPPGRTTLFEDDDAIDEAFRRPPAARATQQQMLLLEEDNAKMALLREREVNKIVTSIVELNDVFKDLSHMVKDQGTVLDRIDYNIEQTHTSVYEGYRQLQKADGYHRKNRKMHCIFILGFAVISLFVLLIVTKL